jgi:hypothetical protein
MIYNMSITFERYSSDFSLIIDDENISDKNITSLRDDISRRLHNTRRINGSMTIFSFITR